MATTYPIVKVRNAWSGGPFLVVEHEQTVYVGRFSENAAGEQVWIGRPIEVTKPRLNWRNEQVLATLNLSSNAAETVEDLGDYMALLNAVQAVMVDLNDRVLFAGTSLAPNTFNGVE